jgi:hypothetical protein
MAAQRFQATLLRLALLNLLIGAVVAGILCAREDRLITSPDQDNWKVRAGFVPDSEFKRTKNGLREKHEIILWKSHRSPNAPAGQLVSRNFTVPAILAIFVAGHPDKFGNRIFLTDVLTNETLPLGVNRFGKGWREVFFEMPTGWIGRSASFHAINGARGWKGYLGVGTPRSVNKLLIAYKRFKAIFSPNWLICITIITTLAGLNLMIWFERGLFYALLFTTGGLCLLSQFSLDMPLVKTGSKWAPQGAFRPYARHQVTRPSFLNDSQKIEFWSATNPDDSKTVIASPVFETPRFLAVKIAGYMENPGNRLFLQDAVSGQRHALPIKLLDPRYGQRWIDCEWRLPKPWQNRQVRLIAKTAPSDRMPGWGCPPPDG